MTTAPFADVEGLLDGRHTFENFVVGSGNRLAYAAAKSVAESPGENYSPLLVYAQSGLGKTHLLAAIGHRVRLHPFRGVVRYSSAEAFVDELLGALRRGGLERFRAGFRGVDVLLLDDVQFLAGQPETQEELLQVLDVLHRRRGQVVLTSDRGPEEIADLDERILARFRGGLIVDIQNPDYETRSAILRFKLRQQGEELSPEVVDELAGREFANIRELEGALQKLILLRTVHGEPLTPARVRELLRRSLPPRAVPRERANEFEDFMHNVAQTISSVLEEPDAEPRAPGGNGHFEAAPEPFPAPPVEHTLARWIEGPANLLATQAARRVLDDPGVRYNPLFVNGGTGMGKTHLLNAIAHALAERNGESRACVQSAESFTEEIITAIERGRLPELRARYRSAGALLLDDVHALAGRERTQEEFFHVFNELHARRRPLVLTSDRPPRELEGVERRLVSRFEGGLVVEIGELDFETAARTLLAFLREEGFAVDYPVAEELVRRLHPENVREIQGHAQRAALRAESAGAAKDAAFLHRIFLDAPRPVRADGPDRVDPFFSDPYKVFLHWEPLSDRLIERLD